MEKLLDRMPRCLWFRLTNPYNFAGIPTLPKYEDSLESGKGMLDKALKTSAG